VKIISMMPQYFTFPFQSHFNCRGGGELEKGIAEFNDAEINII
jgi:hypothetical protein